ncbi:MAG: TRAP transporter substrate-binding protein, partial [Gammaproteobacteria bacterium]|nr:TRAP transporter substrate-binding protein [Gammaproteobacteria bacterium]
LVLAVDSAAARTPPVEVVVAGTAFPNTEGERIWLGFQRQAESSSRGGLKLRMLIRGELGPEEQIVSGLRRGRVQFANVSALAASTVVPELGLLYAPFLFESAAEADYVLDRYLADEFRRLLATRGLEFIVWHDLGYSIVWSRRKPILTPADARGVRLRVGSSKAAQLLGEALRADVIPLPFSDIIPALQRGLIEAGENGLTLYSRTGIAREAPHATLTQHNLALSLIVADKRWWDRQSPAHREILRTSYPTAERLRQSTRAEIAADLRAAAQLGFTAYELNHAQRAQWIAATRGTHQALIEAIGGQSARLYAGIQAARRAYAAQRTASAQRSASVQRASPQASAPTALR